LVIKELAYEETELLGEGGIHTGYRGLVSANNLDYILNNIAIPPNPATTAVDLHFKYTSDDILQISILDNTGKQLLQLAANNSSNFSIETLDWTEGRPK